MADDFPLCQLISSSEAQRRLGLSRTHTLRLADKGELGTVLRTPIGRLFYPEQIERAKREREVSAA